MDDLVVFDLEGGPLGDLVVLDDEVLLHRIEFLGQDLDDAAFGNDHAVLLPLRR